MSRKKQLSKDGPDHTKQLTGSESNFSGFEKADLFPVTASLLYFIVHFLPDFGAYDGFGPQWLYITIIDLLVLGGILVLKNQYAKSLGLLLGNLYTKLLLAFVLIAGVSVFQAINPTEGWVCYVRLLATIIAFCNLGILFMGRPGLLKPLAWLISLILLVESMLSLKQFLQGVSDIKLTELILSLKGFTGNKNIFAASLVMKFPFVVYCIYNSKLISKLFHTAVLLLGILVLFLVNARASYLSLILITSFMLGLSILQYVRNRNMNELISDISFIIIPILAAFFASNIMITNAKNLQDEKGGYGTVTERLGTVAAFNAEDNQVRIRLWKHAIDYTSKHPFMGCGYGNWKIASIPYQQYITNDLIVPVHSHNDFVEAFAELGLAGGLAYLGMFFCILLFTIKTFRSDADKKIKDLSLFSFLAFIAYSIDAFFNFPGERPISQVFFAFLTAMNVTAYIAWHTREEKENKNDSRLPLYGFIGLILLIPSVYITYLTYKSLVVQRSVMADLTNEPLKLNWKEVLSSFPPIPNLCATGQPIEAIKGRYLSEAGRYDEALVLLDKGREANPVIGYSEFLKAGLYFKQGKYDSASRNALVAYYTRPRANTYYQTLIAVLAKTKDTANIQKAFETYIKYRNEVFPWNLYLIGMLNAKDGKADAKLLAMADSAIQHFKNDSTAKVLLDRKREILMNTNQAAAAQSSGVVINYAAAQQYYNEAVKTFGNGQKGQVDLSKAGSLFMKSYNTNPSNWVALENAGICYFNNMEYPKAISLFEKEIGMGVSSNGKPEFFMGVALVNTGQKEKGCPLLHIASKKGYKEADAAIQKACQ